MSGRDAGLGTSRKIPKLANPRLYVGSAIVTIRSFGYFALFWVHVLNSNQLKSPVTNVLRLGKFCKLALKCCIFFFQQWAIEWKTEQCLLSLQTNGFSSSYIAWQLILYSKEIHFIILLDVITIIVIWIVRSLRHKKIPKILGFIE